MHAQPPSSAGEKAPLITFVVPCYNLPSEWVCACMDSILALPLLAEEREIIVVDDGSDTPVEESLRSYGSSITCLRCSNGGLAAARNLGMEHARGTYIQFVDGDDELSLQAYTRCLSLLKSLLPDMLLFRFKGKTQSPSPPVSGVFYMQNYNLRASACLYLFRRTMVGKLRFIPGILHEDEAFTPQLLLRAASVCDTGQGAYVYRRRQHSITNCPDRVHIGKRLADKEAVLLLLNELSRHQPVPAAQALCRRVAQLTMDLLVDTARLTSGRQDLTALSLRLRQQRLYPLPRILYTPLYFLFSLISAYPFGLSVLYFLLRGRLR